MYIFLLGTVYDHSLPSIDTSAHTWRRYKIHDREATCITPIEHSQIFTLPYIHAYNMFIYMKDRDMCRCKWTHIQSHLNSYTHTHTHTHTLPPLKVCEMRLISNLWQSPWCSRWWYDGSPAIGKKEMWINHRKLSFWNNLYILYYTKGESHVI